MKKILTFSNCKNQHYGSKLYIYIRLEWLFTIIMVYMIFLTCPGEWQIRLDEVLANHYPIHHPSLSHSLIRRFISNADETVSLNCIKINQATFIS
jgi:hypothetical protein